MVITVINQKGGAGKTTLSVHLACHLADQGKKVAVIDNDPQRSATNWLQVAAPEIPVRSIEGNPEKLATELEQMSRDYDAVVCDGAPRLNADTKVLMFLADRVLIPVRPSMLDLQATAETKRAVDQVRDARLIDGLGEPNVRLVLNCTRTVGVQSAVMRQAMDVLQMPLAKQSVALRDAFSKAVTESTVVTRMKKDAGAIAASVELLNLFDEVFADESDSKQAA